MKVKIKPLLWEKGQNYTYADFCGIRYCIVRSGVTLDNLGIIGDPKKDYYTVVKKMSGYNTAEFGNGRTIHKDIASARAYCQESTSEDMKKWFIVE